MLMLGCYLNTDYYYLYDTYPAIEVFFQGTKRQPIISLLIIFVCVGSIRSERQDDWQNNSLIMRTIPCFKSLLLLQFVTACHVTMVTSIALNHVETKEYTSCNKPEQKYEFEVMHYTIERVCTTWYALVHARFCPPIWFPFCMARYREKKQKNLKFFIYFIVRFKISTKCVCANILVTLL